MTSIRIAKVGAAALLVLTGCIAGCKKTANNSINYKSTIDAWYSAHPSCLWQTSQKLPVQIAASNDDQNAPYAALVDQGLLVRSTSEKKIIIISKQEVNYDLSDKGRSDWTVDPNQPGYGNFCYGHRSVQSIASSTSNSGEPGATTVVNYVWGFSGAPDWAQAPALQNAFPQVRTDVSGNGTASATLVDTQSGWQIQSPPPTGSGLKPKALSPSDGKIVE